MNEDAEYNLKTKNNIKKLLKKQNKSINALSKYTQMTYSNTHDLVNRDNLNDTKLITLLKVAEFLNVDIRDLYKN